ncbi:PREDICTED: RRP15-like protein [Nicrophorus vespilloides]|uniref:RRP15-like protein n=1 Tax=Nicrophorus vespilloides TaxID=110193 RepID=A0ABM1M3N3_NICVS|nr:PREDICTED: RRP15-like protein [Nicrophorus vespilloides]
MKKMGVKPKLVVQYDSDDSDSEKSTQNSAEEESEQDEKDDFQFSDEDAESDLSDGEDMDDDDDDDSENDDAGDDEDKTEVPTETVQKDDTDSNKESDDEDDDSEGMDVDDEDDGDGNKGWADSISKILNTKKPAKKKSLVLSKAKLLADSKKDVPKPKSAGFEIVKEDGKVDEAKIEVAIKNDKKRKEDSAKLMKLSIKGLRKMPNALERPRERALSKTATKGVVQLFNAVRKQQKEIKDKLEEAGPMESKKEKAMMSIDRGAFLDSLKKDKSVIVDNLDVMKNLGKKQQKEVEGDESSWSVLQPNFRMGANLKDWDKKDEEEQEMEEEIEFA